MHDAFNQAVQTGKANALGGNRQKQGWCWRHQQPWICSACPMRPYCPWGRMTACKVRPKLTPLAAVLRAQSHLLTPPWIPAEQAGRAEQLWKLHAAGGKALWMMMNIIGHVIVLARI